MCERECGACKACCFGPEITCAVELVDSDDKHKVIMWRKPRRQHCGFLCSTGCSIQDEKPGACNEFECEWLKGNIKGANTRPNQCGVVLWLEPMEVFGGDVLVAEEAYPGAEHEEQFIEICEHLSQHRALAVYRRGPSRTLMLEGKAKVVVDLMKDPRFEGAKLVPYERILEEEKEAGVR